jgi:hypothetical protein
MMYHICGEYTGDAVCMYAVVDRIEAAKIEIASRLPKKQVIFLGGE